MKRILVLSDSHGDCSLMFRAVEKEKPDLVFHLGDHISDAEELEFAYPELNILKVPGNCDWGRDDPLELIITVENVRILLCHGHMYGVKQGITRLSMHCRDNSVAVALFGHTHKACRKIKNGVFLFNPGSCGMGQLPSYGMLTIDKGNVKFMIKG